MLILGISISFVLLVVFLILSLFKDLKLKKKELENISLELSILKIKSRRILKSTLELID
jgi:nitric oxide reductase large subunit